MSYLKVEGHRTLVRETASNAIVNTDRNAYTIYMNRIREARKSNDDLKFAVENSEGATLNLSVWRRGEQLSLLLTPKRVDEKEA